MRKIFIDGGANLGQSTEAFCNEKDGLKDEEKQLILQTVFRPSSTGIIKDEASPPTIVDIFAKLNGKK